MSAIDALPVARNRMALRSLDRSQVVSLWRAAWDLWEDEFQSYMALKALGLTSAANCAWQRRNNAKELTQVVTAAV